MKSTPAAHRSHPWRVHTLAADFEVIDVWRFELPTSDGGLDRVLRAFWSQMDAAEKGVLSRIRLAVGKVTGWDDAPNTLPIPGCTETSLVARLPAAERATEPSPFPAAAVTPVYRFADEALYEVSNDTVHALLHIGMVEGGAELAVYVKSRGAFTRVYMAAIWPARHWILYPRLVKSVERRHAAAIA